jgi:glycosyltransferase involved in cell wall biosynthesis
VRLVVYVETEAVGGAEIATGYLLEALRPDIDVVTVGPFAGVVEWLASRRPGARAIVVPPMRSKHELGAARAHHRVLREQAPAIFHAVLTFQTACQWPLLTAAFTSGIAPLAVEHLPPVADTRRGVAAKRRSARRLAAHVAVSAQVARAVESAFGLAGGSVRTIYNGVPDIPVDPIVLPGQGPAVVAAGRLDRLKGFDVLVRAFEALPDARLVLVGAGAEEQHLQALAAGAGLRDRIHFVGWSDDVRRYLRAADVVAVPSRLEALGLVAVEAMLAGRPVVASRVGGLPEVVVPDTTGLLVPPDDPPALAAALRELLDDPARRELLGSQARARALEHFSVDAMKSAYEALYASIDPAATASR